MNNKLRLPFLLACSVSELKFIDGLAQTSNTSFLKVFLLACFILLSCLPLNAQPQTYTFTKSDKSVTLTSKVDTITFPGYKKVDRKTQERTVTINNVRYKSVIKKTKHGRLQEMFDESGNKLATVFLDGVNINNIVFADGSQFTFKRTGRTNWAYFMGEKEVAKSFYYMEDKLKKFVVQPYDSTITSQVFPAISLDYGMKNSRTTTSSKKTSLGIMIGVGAMLALVRIAADADDL
jgi:hypothetical protein